MMKVAFMPIKFDNPRPLYLQIADHIKKKIAGGEYKIGEKLPSQRQLSEFYGVSSITIRKAISSLVHDGVLYSRVGKGLYVARKTPPADLSRHKSIGLVLNEIKNPFFSLILHGIEQKLSENGFNLLFSNSSNKLEKEEKHIQHFIELGVDGLIVASLTHIFRASNLIRNLLRDGFPVVMISFILDEDVYYVGTDHQRGAFLATEHLIQLGHSRVAYIGGEEGSLLSKVREKGFRQALLKHNLSIEEKHIFHSPLFRQDYQSGYIVGSNFVHLSEKPTGVFVYKDMVAIGFEQALLDKGLRVPEDVAIVGFDDIEHAKFCTVPLTTIHQDTDKIGSLAAEKIIRLIQKETVPVQEILKPKLVIRQSCGARK